MKRIRNTMVVSKTLAPRRNQTIVFSYRGWGVLCHNYFINIAKKSAAPSTSSFRDSCVQIVERNTWHGPSDEQWHFTAHSSRRLSARVALPASEPCLGLDRQLWSAYCPYYFSGSGRRRSALYVLLEVSASLDSRLIAIVSLASAFRRRPYGHGRTSYCAESPIIFSRSPWSSNLLRFYSHSGSWEQRLLPSS